MRVVRFPECSHNPSLDVLSTRETLGPKQSVVVLATVVDVILHEVAPGGQQPAAHWGKGWVRCVRVCEDVGGWRVSGYVRVSGYE